jgi:anaerobic magnesium-protoporphyrin IX monomethyl ester cyclase
VRTPPCADADPFATFRIPAYDCIDMNAYKERVGKCTLEIARGCPHACNFCLNTQYYPTRYKPITDIMKEVELLIGRYAFTKLSVISPELLIDAAYMSDVLDQLALILRGTTVTWACATSAKSLSRALLDKMAKAHCRSIFIGIESGADDVHCLFGRKLDLATLEERLLAVADAGMGVLASFIIGLPGETEASACRTIELAHRLKAKYTFIKTIQFNTFGPFPGTDFTTNIAQYGFRILPIDPAYYPVVPAVEMAGFPKEIHYRVWHRVWKEFFPAYYDNYLEIEAAALLGRNPRLAAFCNGK